MTHKDIESSWTVLSLQYIGINVQYIDAYIIAQRF